MICFHCEYQLGDKHEFDSPDAFLQALVMRLIAKSVIIQDVRKGLAAGLRLFFDVEADVWKLEVDGTDIGKYIALEQHGLDALHKKKNEFSEAIVETLGIEDLMEFARQQCCILPLYLLDHSGLFIQTTSFGDPWDSGQIGWIYADTDMIVKEFGALNPETVAKAQKLLLSEVDEYNAYRRVS